jgi:hypothetical protein
MLRKTMIVLAKAAPLTSGLTVEAFAHGSGRRHSWSALRMVARKLVAPTSQAAVLFYGRLFEIARGAQNPCSAATCRKKAAS